MVIDFSQVDNGVIDRMALYLGILIIGGVFLSLMVECILRILKMPDFIRQSGTAVLILGWAYYWATQILNRF